MNIQSLSKEERRAIVELNADDLVIICNALYAQFEEKKDKGNFLQLYSDMMIARDLCQYGSLDNFCLRNIVKCRNDVEKGLGGILSDADIDTFNKYIELNGIETAFSDSAFKDVYMKIVGEHGKRRSSDIKELLEND